MIAEFASLIAALAAAAGVWLHIEGVKRENRRKEYDRRALATALFSEIHNRASRCVLDGITWATKHVESDKKRTRHDALKFRPFAPAVYATMADRLMELPPEVAHLVIRFYNALEAADRQIQGLADNPEEMENKGGGSYEVASKFTAPSENFKVAARFHQVQLPALEALNALGPLVDDVHDLERALRDGDRQYLADEAVMHSVNLTEPPLLRDALRIRIEWFQNNPKLKSYAHQRL